VAALPLSRRGDSRTYATPPTTPDSRKLQSTPPVSDSSGPSYDGRDTASRPATAPSAHATVAGMFQPPRNQ
jgi:hypothetical protein